MTRTTLALLLAALLLAACAAPRQALQAELPPMPVQAEAPPKPLDRDLFKGDRPGRITEEDLARVLDAPVELEEGARIGILPVRDGYDADEALPLDAVPAALEEALDAAALADSVTEIAAEWPTTSGIAGLREIAARYRVEYVVLYRARFVERVRPNGWAWLYPTGIGLFALPGRTMEVAGVVEATLFEARTGTLLFTAYSRVHREERQTVWQRERKRREIRQDLLAKAAEELATSVVAEARALTPERDRTAAARPGDSS